jgi:hypothetical protein
MQCAGHSGCIGLRPSSYGGCQRNDVKIINKQRDGDKMTVQAPTQKTVKTTMGGPQAPVRVSKTKTTMGAGYAPVRVTKVKTAMGAGRNPVRVIKHTK